MSLPPTKQVLHTCKIVNYFYLPIYFLAGGGKIVEGRGCRKGQGDGARRVGEGGGIRSMG